ncbi:MAG: hypothetical protein ATN35_03165 [Epulopiscium sp. Nele67-Bin004]|nr:MAG: hypothetical protein ATN35_03165 [Epulopiscium sp. Nele67-Bin004]
MYTHNARISIHQFRILLILQMFNMSILMLPRMVANMVGQDGYWLPFLGFIVGTVYIFAITGLTNRFRGKSFVEYSQIILSKPLGIILSALFLVKIVITTGFELRLFAEMISRVLLPNTPLEMIILLMLFSVYYLVKSGVESTGRMAEILAIFVFVPFVIVMLLIMFKADYEQLLPMFRWETAEALKGGFSVSVTFMPLEFVLVLGAFVTRPKQVRHSCFFAITVITIIEVIIIILTFTGIGTIESSRELWPVLTLMESIQMPGSFFENQSILMMAWWIMSIFMYISGGMYVSSLIASHIFSFKRENVTVLPLIPIVFLVAMAPDSLVTAYQYFADFQQAHGIWFLLVVPLVLWAIAILRKVGDTNATN